MNPEKTALIIFAREPKDGKVKTRLAKSIPTKLVTKLYTAFLNDIFSFALKVPVNERFIFYAGSSSAIPFLRQFQKNFTLKRQTGSDLGVRMLRAFNYCYRKRFDKVVMIGTDCLTMTIGDMNTAFRQLSGHDCVIGPSRDGGYYLIGFCEPHKELFENISWSTEHVLSQTLQKANKIKKNVYLLGQKEDIDTIESLRRFAKKASKVQLAPQTYKILVQNGIS